MAISRWLESLTKPVSGTLPQQAHVTSTGKAYSPITTPSGRRDLLMAKYAGLFGPHNPGSTYVVHKYPEQLFDTGEVLLNYATLGDVGLPPLLLIPGQSESWWGYEDAMPLLAERFCV